LPSGPQGRWWDAFDETDEEAAEASLEEGEQGAGVSARAVFGGFFSAADGLLTASHMPVETAQ
jgi:hypothetical protein